MQRQQWTRNESRSYCGTYNHNKESPLCSIDGHPLIQKKMCISWESSTNQIARGIQNYHPPQVPSLNTPDHFRMNFDNSWMVSYGSKLRKKVENFDKNVLRIFQAYRGISRVLFARFEQRRIQGMHLETVASTKREHPGLLESSGGGSNPSSMHPRMKSTDVMKETLRKDNFWMTDVQKTVRWYSHLQVRMIRHHGESKRKVYTPSFDKKILERCHTNWRESYFQDREEDWERIHVWGLITLPPPQKIQKTIWSL